MEYCVRVQGEEIKFWSENKFQYELMLNNIRFANPTNEVTVSWAEKNKTFSRVYKHWNEEIKELELETL
jgi:hypothetical protein